MGLYNNLFLILPNCINKILFMKKWGIRFVTSQDGETMAVAKLANYPNYALNPSIYFNINTCSFGTKAYYWY